MTSNCKRSALLTLGLIILPALAVGGLSLFHISDSGKMALAASEQKVDLNWNILTLEGEEVNLAETVGDQVLFLNFWSTWCPPCIEEMPAIEKLYRNFKDRMAFACLSNEKPDVIREFRSSRGYTVPMYRYRGNPPREFRSRGLPATFVISKQGTLAFRHLGKADWASEKFMNLVRELIAR